MVEPLSSIAKGAVNTVFDGVVDYVKGIFDEECTVKYNPSAGVEQWRKLATKALQMTVHRSKLNQIVISDADRVRWKSECN